MVMLLAGLIFGAGAALVLNLLYQKEKYRGKTGLLTIYQDGDIKERWVKDPSKLKIAGKDAFPLLSGHYRHHYRNRPAYVFDAETGLPLVVTHDPARLKEQAERQEAGWTWPDAYDVAIAYNDVRAETVAKSQLDDKANWAKIGVVVGVVVGILVAIAIGMLVKLGTSLGGQ